MRRLTHDKGITATQIVLSHPGSPDREGEAHGIAVGEEAAADTSPRNAKVPLSL